MVTSTKTLSPAEKAKAALAYAEAKALEAEWEDFNAKEELFRKWRRGLPRVEPTHGKVNTYKSHRCRCDECKRAMSEYMKDYNERKGISKSPRIKVVKPVPPPKPKRISQGRKKIIREDRHGTLTNYGYGCRCEPCVSYHREYMRERRPKSTIKHGTEYAYRHKKCRCGPCKRASRDARWRREHRNDPPLNIKHGTASSYQHQKCRCLECSEAFTEYNSKRHQRVYRGSR